MHSTHNSLIASTPADVARHSVSDLIFVEGLSISYQDSRPDDLPGSAESALKATQAGEGIPQEMRLVGKTLYRLYAPSSSGERETSHYRTTFYQHST